MSFEFKTLSEFVDPGQTIDTLKIEKIIDVYLKNLVDQFQAGDKSFKFNKDVEIKNYDKFYDELTKYDTELYTDWDCINLKDQNFLIKEIENIRSVEEDINHINVVYDDTKPEDFYFKYSEKKIVDNDHELLDGNYKKYMLYKRNFPKRCVFGQLYSRTKKDNKKAGVADAKYEKSYEYLDLSGYLLYDYVHNYPKYSGNPICNYLNRFLEEQILNILNFDNSYIPEMKDIETFTLYDIIYPNSHYIYNIKGKNFCLPVDRVICHYDEKPENIGSKENLKYEKKLTVANFMQDIFGMSKDEIHKDIQDIFINCLNKKLLKLFIDIRTTNLFYNQDLTLIFSDVIALFAFFVKFNDNLHKGEKDENNDYVLDTEIYKSISLSHFKKNKSALLYSDLPFLYTDANLEAARKTQKNVNKLAFINSGTHDIDSQDHKAAVMTKEKCSACFQNITSYIYKNNFIIDVEKNELYNFISESMLRIGKFGALTIINKNYQGKKCDADTNHYTNELIREDGVSTAYNGNFSDFCVVNGTKNVEAQKNNSYVISQAIDVGDTNDNVLDISNLNFYSGIYGLIILQTIFLNTVMDNSTYETIFRLYNIGIKSGFAQHYIWSLMKEIKNKILEYYSNDNLIELPFIDNDILDIEHILRQLLKSIFIDRNTYQNLISENIKADAVPLEINNINIYSSNNDFVNKKFHIFSNLLNYYNSRMSEKIIIFNSKKFEIHSK